MKELLENIIKTYLKEFPEEEERLESLVKFISENTYEQIINWNNFTGHLVAGGFIYAQKEKRFLIMHHKDLNMDLYPGGHFNPGETPLEAAIREVKEETGIKNLQQVIIQNKLIPLDIDIQKIRYNARLNLPGHVHFDFRYLFVIESAVDIALDESELSNYRWITKEEFQNQMPFGAVITKIEKYMLQYKEGDMNEII